jgi:uncharacterized protein YbbC (DUF1343 family)|tara:strand:+ start:1590 stop:2750 length:1161 start_codon:yes stop_codon:yes gene_type:complete
MAVKLKSTLLFYLFLATGIQSCAQVPLVSGAESFEKYLHSIANKKVGVVAHQASLVNGKTHLVDTLLSLGVAVQKVFAPEHGFRGNADAGETIYDQKDKKTGLEILSLHGKTKKPSKEDLANISVMIFDLQDVGVRFYTYLSTLHYVMEACAENNIPLIVLDRPNPNAHYVDGPVLKKENKSFIGMHPVPIVYGMTIGEYAKMINGEGWLSNKTKCDLTIIKIKNYTHETSYELPVRPSPNLPNKQAIALYPSLCLLEPTKISIGRGTEMQFQIYGHPDLNKDDFSFKPLPNFGSKNPKLKDKICYGKDLSKIEFPKKIHLEWLINAYNESPNKSDFFLKGFHRIAGTKNLESQIKAGISEKEIRESWKKGLNHFKSIREKYLIYR